MGLGIQASSILKCVTAMGSRESTHDALLKPNDHDKINIRENLHFAQNPGEGRDHASDKDFA